MCMKVAAELGYAKMDGLDLDERLLNIARKNMRKLQLNVGCIKANAADFDGYAAVFYFYNPFGKPVFEKVIQRLIESQNKHNRDIGAVYYNKRTIKPVDTGFIVGLLRRLVQKR